MSLAMVELLCVFLAVAPVNAVALSRSIYGSGASTVSQLMAGTVALVNSKNSALNVHYAEVGSQVGQQQFVVGSVQFTESDVPLNAAEEAQLRFVPHFTLPHVLETISVFTYIPGITRLRLTAPLVAQIFQGDIIKWNNPAIVALNPQLKGVSQTINVVYRSDGSGTSFIFSQWLQKAAPGVWKLGVNPLIPVPASYHAFPAKGSLALAGNMRSNPFSIGYLGSSLGRFEELAEVSLKNAAGTFLTAATADALSAIPRPLPPSASSWAAVSMVNSPGSLTWPMTSFVYTFVRKDATALGYNGGLLKAFLLFINSPTGQGIAQFYDFQQLPTSISTKNIAAVNQITLAPGVALAFPVSLK